MEEKKKKKYKLKGKVITIILCILCLVIGGVVGYILPRNTSEDERYNYELLSEIMEIIDEKWVNPNGEDSDTDSTMIESFVSSLGDAYTSYMTISDAQEFASSINGSVVGIGVTFTTINSGGLVTKVFDGAPADKAGMLAGDIIIEVDGASMEGLTSDEIKEAVTGDANTKVEIMVLRDNKEKTFTITRKEVETDVSYSLGENYGYLELTTFGDDTVDRVEEALKYFVSEEVENIVIDVRDNSGGYLDSVVSILSLFVDEGELLFTLNTSDDSIEYTAEDSNKYSFTNGYILMNGSSASCSEVLIGALTEILDYQTIGETSFGKGIAQSQTYLSNGAILKYTYATWDTPSGVNIHGTGFEPDYEVKESDISDYYISEEFDETYEYDDVDDNIAIVQKILKKCGYDIDRTDGYFSKKTRKAIKQYQSDQDLDETGKITYDLYLKLYSSVATEIYVNSEDKVLARAEELMK